MLPTDQFLLFIAAGVRALWGGSSGGLDLSRGGAAPAPADLRRLFWRGLITNALNPKVALFLGFGLKLAFSDSPVR